MQLPYSVNAYAYAYSAYVSPYSRKCLRFLPALCTQSETCVFRNTLVPPSACTPTSESETVHRSKAAEPESYTRAVRHAHILHATLFALSPLGVCA